ncbi:MAG: hypothetical protein JWP44_4827, partial [Mucilaginibacter sp.]|nr:hypothetical protein [Mucilaginibacter sp.]
IEQRNRRRLGAATRIVSRLAGMLGGGVTEERTDAALVAQQAATLTALTSFELFDRLAELLGSDEAADQVSSLVKKAFAC